MVKQKKKRKIDLLFITACISTSLVLLLIGIVALLLLTANDLSRHLKQEMTVEVILKESITETQFSALFSHIYCFSYGLYGLYGFYLLLLFLLVALPRRDLLAALPRRALRPLRALTLRPRLATLLRKVGTSSLTSTTARFVSSSVAR